MSDEREFQIKITGDASSLVTESQKGADALGGVSNSVKESGKAEEDASEKVEKHAVSHRQLHKAMHAVNELVPGLGTAMQFSFGVAAGSVAVLVMAIQGLHSWLEKIKERYREAAETATAGWRAQQDQAMAAKDSAEEYATTLKHIAENTEALRQAEDKELAVLNAIEAARQKIIAAQEAAEMAAAKGDKAAEAEVAARYKRKKSAEELAAEEDAIAQKQAFLAAEKRKAAEDYAKMQAAEAAKEKGPSGVVEGAEAAHGLKKLQEATDKAKEDLDTARRTAAENPKGLAAGGSEDGYVITPAELQADVKAREEAYAKAQATETAAQAAIDKPKKEAERLAAEAQRTAAAAEQSKKQIDAREAELAKDRAVHEINKKAAAKLNEVETGSELEAAGFKKNSALGKTLLGDINAEEARAHGERMTGEQAAGIQQLVAALHVAGKNQEQINHIVADMMDLHLSHTQKLQELSAALFRVKAQTRNAHNDGT